MTVWRRISKGLFLSALIGTLPVAVAQAEIPYFEQSVQSGLLPPMEKRLPANPLVVTPREGQEIGKYGGKLRTLIGNPSDVKLMFVNGYARLVRYTADFEIEPDILESVEVTDGRIFTMKLREGHKWSNGEPFTSEDFRYWWEDIAHNADLSPVGPPSSLKVSRAMRAKHTR